MIPALVGGTSSDSFAGITVPEGDPGELQTTAATFRGLAGGIEALGSDLRSMPGVLSSWSGPASVNYAGACLSNGAVTDAGVTAMETCASAVRRYADDLDDAQEKARAAIKEAKEAQKRIDRAESDIEDAQGRAGVGATNLLVASGRVVATGMTGAPSPDALADQSAAQSAINDAERDETRARRELEPAKEDLDLAKERGEEAEEAAESAAKAATGALVSVASSSPAAAAGTAPAADPGEYRALYGGAEYADRSWETGDFQGYDDGKLRLALFIAPPIAGPNAKNKGKGDGRGFDPLFSPNRTRAYIEIDFESDRAYVRSNPSCPVDGDCEDAKDIGDGSFGDGSSEVELEEEDDGTIHVSWELNQSLGVKVPIFGRVPGVAGPSIDGDLRIRPRRDGGFQIEVDGDRYPSWEAYYYDGEGYPRPLIQEEEGKITDLVPGPGNRRARESYVP